MRATTVAATSIVLAISCPSAHAADAQDRYLDIPADNSVETFDLASVTMLGTHRFTIARVEIDNPDVLRLRLTALGVLEGYCKRPVGKYAASNDLIAMGRPDMPVHEIAVQLYERTANGVTRHWKTVWWDYPYSKLADQTAKGMEEDPTVFMCGDTDYATTVEFLRARNEIVNGVKMTEMFDCAHGLWGLIAADPTHNFAIPVRPGTYAYDAYVQVCASVLKEPPYMPPDPSK